MSKGPKVTIYMRGELLGNIQRVEARLVGHGHRKYAQYDNAVFVKYVPKGKRKTRQRIVGFQPYFIILEGWGHPEPEGMWQPPQESDGPVTFQQARYSAFDKGWERDFERNFAEYLENDNVQVIADYRYNQERVTSEA